MKTTLDLVDALIRAACELAGLRRAIAEQKREPEFRLRKASFAGRGVRPGKGWEGISALAYEGRGGDPTDGR
jgi:hypothetical protein